MNNNILFNEWLDVKRKLISYSRAGIDDNMSDEVYQKGEALYDRKKEIEGLLLSSGYEIVDGDKPYSFELKRVKEV